MNMRTETVEIAGETFRVRAWGDPGAPLLLLLHGFPEHGGAWHEIAVRLADRFHCVAPDQRGYGASPRPHDVASYRISRLVADALGVLDAYAPGAPARAVIGHDWGASVAYALAIAAPERMQALVIGNGVHPIPFQRELARGGAQSEASQYIEWLRAEGSEDKLAAGGLSGLFRMFAAKMDTSWMTEADREGYAEAWGHPGAVRGMVNWYRATPLKVAAPGRPIPPEALPEMDPAALRVRPPHLLLWGLADTALLPESRDGLAELCDDFRGVVEYPRVDHWLFHHEPGATAAEIRAFLA